MCVIQLLDWVVMKERVFLFHNTPKQLDPPFKMDLDFWYCFGEKPVLKQNKYGKATISAKINVVAQKPTSPKWPLAEDLIQLLLPER